VALVLVATLIGSVMPQRWWDRMETITAAEEDRGGSEQGRLHFWGVARRMADEKPLTGVGFSGYTRSYLTYDPDAGELGRTRAVHSAWFGVLAEMGYPGLILMIALLTNACVTVIRVRRKASRDPALADLKAYAGSLQMSLAAYIVGMTFLNGQYNEMLWHLLALGVVLERLAEAPATATVSVPAKSPRPVARVPAMASQQARSGHRVG
jgi:O-antigen ligase